MRNLLLVLGLQDPPSEAPEMQWMARIRVPDAPLVFQNQLSGNLLRKFKNSNGWQKLWVVFTNFCLFFYKSHQVSAHGAAGPDLASACSSRKHTQMSGSAGFQPATSFEIFGSKTVTLPVCSDGLCALPYSRCSEGGGGVKHKTRGPSWCS